MVVGQQIDNFEITRLIGMGGMASVYLARDIVLQRDVVIKMMLPALAQDEKLRLRFQREARATAQLRHENIVALYSTGMVDAQCPYIALEYVPGGTLSDKIQACANNGQRMPVDDALILMRQIADALVVAHDAGIVHRDLKPSNILLRNDGTAVLSDLGIAAVQQTSVRLTRTNGVLGTPHYMSPEQALGKPVDGRSDIYSIGVILYELLSGQLPFDADSPVAIALQHVNQYPTALEEVQSGLPDEIYDVVQTCLQKDPGERYQSAVELSGALEFALQAQNPIVVRTSTLIVTPSPDTQEIEDLEELPGAVVPISPAQNGGEVGLWLKALAIIAVISVIAALTAFWLQNRSAAEDSKAAAATAMPAIVESLSPEPAGASGILKSSPTPEPPTLTSVPLPTVTIQPTDAPTRQMTPTLQTASEPRGCVNDGNAPFLWTDAQIENGNCDSTNYGLQLGDEVHIISTESVIAGGGCGNFSFIKIQSVADPLREGWIKEELIDPLLPGEACGR